MTPEQMADRLVMWICVSGRRVACVEPEGPRRTWALYEGGRQVGLVRLRLWQGAEGQREWRYEASDRTRAMLGPRAMLGL